MHRGNGSPKLVLLIAAACLVGVTVAENASAQGLLKRWRERQQPATSTEKNADAAKPSDGPAYDESKGYKLEDGPYAASEIDIELERKDGSKIPLKIRFPEKPNVGGEKIEIGADKLLPCVIFSHGAGGGSNAFPDLTEHLATHGYVVVLPTHRDSIKLRKDAGEKPRDLANPSYVIKGVKPFERVEDCTLILDSLDKIEAAIVPRMQMKVVKGEGDTAVKVIDREKLGIAGHSAGALTAQLAIGAKARSLESFQPKSYAQTRFKSAVLISGQGTKTRLFTEESWNEIDKPMLVISGTLDTVESTRDTPESRCEPFEFARPGQKYLVFIEGATHSSYGGYARMRSKSDEDVGDVGMISRVTTCSVHAFLDSTLMNDEKARAYLDSESLVELSKGKTTYKRK
jgi:predicted dienelactone hydrolase